MTVLLISIIVALIVVCLVTMASKSKSTPALQIRVSPLGGRGVFAGRLYRKGDVIETCPTLNRHDDDWGGNATTDYSFGGNNSNSLLALGYGSLYNHSDDASAEYSIQDDDNVMVFKAKRTVKPNEEITVDYGSDWFTSRGYKKVILK